MFDGPAAATAALRTFFSAAQADRITAALVPAIAFEPVPNGPAVLGATRSGGGPDMAPGSEWPRPAAPEDAEAIAGQGSEGAASEMRRHPALGLPHAFLAQIDLAEAAALGPVGAALPPDGRLLFFYDLAIGPWETGSRPVRALWDRSPREALAPLEVPTDLAAAAARERAAMGAIREEYGGAREGTGEEGTSHGAPARATRMRAALMLPHLFALELDRLPEVADACHGGDGSADAQALCEAYHDAMAEDDDLRPGRRWRRHQLLGSPRPEQDDPRLDAAVASEFGQQHLAPEEWARHRAGIMARARDWRLLLLDEGLAVQGRDGMTDHTDVGLERRPHALPPDPPGFTAEEGMLEGRARPDRAGDAVAPGVVHLAGRAGVRCSNEDPCAFLDADILGSFIVMEAALREGAGRLLMASSSSVCDADASKPFAEADRLGLAPSLLADAVLHERLIDPHDEGRGLGLPRQARRVRDLDGQDREPLAQHHRAHEAVQVVEEGEPEEHLARIGLEAAGAVAQPPPPHGVGWSLARPRAAGAGATAGRPSARPPAGPSHPSSRRPRS